MGNNINKNDHVKFFNLHKDQLKNNFENSCPLCKAGHKSTIKYYRTNNKGNIYTYSVDDCDIQTGQKQ